MWGGANGALAFQYFYGGNIFVFFQKQENLLISGIINYGGGAKLKYACPSNIFMGVTFCFSVKKKKIFSSLELWRWEGGQNDMLAPPFFPHFL